MLKKNYRILTAVLVVMLSIFLMLTGCARPARATNRRTAHSKAVHSKTHQRIPLRIRHRTV